VARLHKLRRRGYGEPMGPGWRLAWVVLYYPASVVTRLRYRNIERIPPQGGLIIVTNHVSHVDPFLVTIIVFPLYRYIDKQEVDL